MNSNHDLNLIIKEVKDFFNLKDDFVKDKVLYEWHNSGKTVAESWNKIKPKTEEDIINFYKKTDAYVYDLSVESIRSTRIEWRDSILLYLSQFDNKDTLLDFGGGVGTESIFFSNASLKTTYYDLPSITADFAQYRIKQYANNDIKIALDEKKLTSYDVVVCLEVLEHLVDPIKTMKLIYSKLKKGGLVFLSESFDLIGDNYPSHLKQNKSLTLEFNNLLVEMGFSIIDKICNDRILVLGKFPTVDLVIPTYNAYDYVVECVKSVKTNTTNVPYRFVFVNDASTDDRIKEFYLKEKRDIDLCIENKKNLGFVKTANKGMAASLINDVVLLNTDTVVTNNWLSNLQKSIYKKNIYATANPLSNNASIYSIKDVDVLIKSNISLEFLSKTIEQSSLNVNFEIPVGVGFCMYLKRSIIKEVGLFDEVFERGYGEESDYCMKCNLLGYKHILVDCSFVYHKGHVSMLTTGDISESNDSIDAHEQIIKKRYANYDELIRSFINDGVFNRISQNIMQNIISLMAEKRKKILYVIHSPINGETIGGTEFHVRDLTEGLDDTYAIYVLYLKNGRHFVVEEYINGVKTSYLFEAPFFIDKFMTTNPYLFKLYLRIIQVFDIDIVHIQHLINHTFDVINAAKSIGVPVIMTVHDYYLVSIDYNLLYKLKPNGYFKNLTPTEDYFKDKFNVSNFNNKVWQELIIRHLTAINLFIFPSEITKDELTRVYKFINSKNKIIEHGTKPYVNKIITTKENKRKRFSVLFLGYVNAVQKGSYFLDEVIGELLNNDIEVHLLGSASEYWGKYAEYNNFYSHGNYIRDDVVAILNQINPDLIILASPWPETYSYTYSEALQAQIPVVTFEIGAFIERSKKYGATVLVKDVTSKALTLKILELSKDNNKVKELKKQAKKIKLKKLKDNIEEYNDTYKQILKNSPKLNNIFSEEEINIIKSSAYSLFEVQNNNWEKYNELTNERQLLVNQFNELQLNIQSLEQFKLNVKTSFYYRVYIKINKFYIYKLAKKFKTRLR